MKINTDLLHTGVILSIPRCSAMVGGTPPVALYSGDRVIVLRSVVAPSAAVCILTTMVYPVTYPGLLRDELLTWTVLTIRNMGLLGIARRLLVRWHQIPERVHPEREASPALTGGLER